MTQQRRRLFRDEAFARRGRSVPIDGLLRVTAPHEWLFLAMLGCALLGTLLWANFGNIERGISARCTLISSSPRELGAAAQFNPEVARSVAVGMSARVNLDSTDGAVDGEVQRVDLTPTNSEIRDQMIYVSLPDALPEVWRNGETCGLRIVTDRDSPIRLVAAALPWPQ